MIKLPILALALPTLLVAQAQPGRLGPVLDQPIVTPEVVTYQLQQYLHKKVPKLPVAQSPKDWMAKSAAARRQILEKIVYHGWPKEWVEAGPRFEDAGLVPTAGGYRLRKLRYEIVPGFWSTALLYEPLKPAAKSPGVLNVNGHVGPPGKSVEYKQKRCAEFARMGMYALSLEWMSFGELNQPHNVHWYGGHLDLAGANAVGLFYLAMRKGLDYLAQHPGVDTSRLAVTGLSGGGWQTIMLSSLDERVKAAIPVAGYSALTARLERPGDIGDIEQNPTDMLVGVDYSTLTAMRAPNPTLLIYNAEDDCCFRAPLVKNDIYDRIKPYFRVFNAEANFAWHENGDPADHNYQLDNRMQAYKFLAKQFNLEAPLRESAPDIKTYEELTVGLPRDNLTILALARKLAMRPRDPLPNGRGSDPIPSRAREQLRQVVRYPELRVAHAWASASTKSKGVETRSLRFDFDDGLGATGIWIRAIGVPDDAPATILLNDGGRGKMAEEAAERVNAGDQVLAVNLLLSTGNSNFAQLLATTGDRPLGIRAAQLNAMARWLKTKSIRIQATGMRSQLAALTAAASEPALYTKVAVRDGITSLLDLFEKPVEYTKAPEMFCLDLYRNFDIDTLEKLWQH
jgi:dienelactone hydrolase